MRRTVLAILETAKLDGGHAYFGCPKEKRAVRQLARDGIAHIVAPSATTRSHGLSLDSPNHPHQRTQEAT